MISWLCHAARAVSSPSCWPEVRVRKLKVEIFFGNLHLRKFDFGRVAVLSAAYPVFARHAPW